MLLPNRWGKGQLMAFSGVDGQTDHRRGMVLRSTEIPGELEIRQPENGGTIRFAGGEVRELRFTSDVLEIGGDGECGILVFADAHHLLLRGPWQLRCGEAVASLAASETQLVGVKEFFRPERLGASIPELKSARLAFLHSLHLPENLPEISRRTAMKALAMLKGQIYAPEGRIPCFWSTPDRWPHANMWLWDSAFHALGMRHFRPDLARDFISAVFATQRRDGFIAHMMTPETISSITQPPVLGMAIELVNESEAAPEWVAGLTPKLGLFLEWLMHNRDRDGDGLLEWMPDPHSPHGSDESGMDNSPRFDGAMTLAAADFNAYLANECKVMSRLEPARAAYWLGHSARLCRLLNEFCWDEKLGLYADYDTVAKRTTGVASSAGFLPLLCGAPDRARAERMLAHLHDPKTFGTPLRVPSIAADNTTAYLKDMWRGPVWVNINYLIAVGLMRYGFLSEARELMRETCSEEEEYYDRYGTFFEYYDDRRTVPPPELLRKSDVPPYPGCEYYSQVMFDYGWSGTLYLEMLNLLTSAERG